MTEYKCEVCNYKTNRKSNMNSHIKTKKHSDKLTYNEIYKNKTKTINYTNSDIINEPCIDDLKKDEDKIKIIYKCKKCNIEFNHRQSLHRHKKHETCKEIGDTTANIVVELLKEQMQKMEKKMEKMEEERKEETKKFEEERKEQMKMLYKFMDSNNDITSKSLSTVHFIMAYFTNTPLLEPIEDYEKFLLNNRERESLESILVYQYKEGSISQCIGDLIVATYKKDSPNNQSVWTSDVSRLTYVVNTVVRNVSGWHVDKGGVIVKDKIVQPILDFMLKILIDYNKKITLDFNKKIYNGDKLYALKHIDNCNDLIKFIESGKLCRDIIRYLAPHFHLNKTIKDEESNKKYIEYEDNDSDDYHHKSSYEMEDSEDSDK